MQVKHVDIASAFDLLSGHSATGAVTSQTYKGIRFKRTSENSFSLLAMNFYGWCLVQNLQMSNWGNLPDSFWLDVSLITGIVKSSAQLEIKFKLNEETNQIEIVTDGQFEVNYFVSDVDVVVSLDGWRVMKVREVAVSFAKLLLFVSKDASPVSIGWTGVSCIGGRMYACDGVNGVRIKDIWTPESVCFSPGVLQTFGKLDPAVDMESAQDSTYVYFKQRNVLIAGLLQQEVPDYGVIDEGLDQKCQSRVKIRLLELKKAVAGAGLVSSALDDLMNFQIKEGRLEMRMVHKDNNQCYSAGLQIKEIEGEVVPFKVRFAFLDKLVKLLGDSVVELEFGFIDGLLVCKVGGAECFSSVVRNG